MNIEARSGVLSVVVLGAVLFAGCRQSEHPDLSDLLTTAERTEFRATSTYQDVMDFVTAVSEADERIHLTSYGVTNEGRELPLLVVGDVADPSPETVRATGKTVVYLQGNIHAGEVCGKEALQILLREFAEGDLPNWTESLVLLVAPIYNADGNERFDLRNRPRQHGPVEGMGQRPNAQDLDLNRDHMKLMSPEAQAVARLMTEYDPHVSVDLHTTNGSQHAYHLTYSPPLHPNTDAGILELLRGDWLPEVTRNIKEKHDWDYYYYGNAQGRQGADRQSWYTFDHRPRFNNNYIGLRNRIAILSEAYAYATFSDRVYATFHFVEEILNYANEHSAEIQATVAAADARSVVGESLAVRAAFERSSQPVEILMGETTEDLYISGADTVRMLLRQDVVEPVEMYEYGTFSASESARVPSAYFLPSELATVIEKLEAHGVSLETLDTEVALRVERFQVDSTQTATRAFQGVNERTVWGTYREVTETVPAGTRVVHMDQPLARLIFYLLEPRSDDGLVDWGLMDDVLEVGTDFPVFRTADGVEPPQ